MLGRLRRTVQRAKTQSTRPKATTETARGAKSKTATRRDGERGGLRLTSLRQALDRTRGPPRSTPRKEPLFHVPHRASMPDHATSRGKTRDRWAPALPALHEASPESGGLRESQRPAGQSNVPACDRPGSCVVATPSFLGQNKNHMPTAAKIHLGKRQPAKPAAKRPSNRVLKRHLNPRPQSCFARSPRACRSFTHQPYRLTAPSDSRPTRHGHGRLPQQACGAGQKKGKR